MGAIKNKTKHTEIVKGTSEGSARNLSFESNG